LDESSLGEFAHGEYPRIVAAVALVCGSKAAAEDAVQEALARAWERSTKGEEIASVGAWVTTVSMNLARSWLRRVRAEQRARSRVERPKTDGIDAGDHMDLQRALASLPRRQREAIILHYYLRLDVRDVAETMRAPEGTVKSLLSRARKHLAKALRVTDMEEVG
jgi:RNA polymerase sigma-70 factor (ECF subfamily)